VGPSEHGKRRERSAALEVWEELAGRWKISQHGQRYVAQWEHLPMEAMSDLKDERMHIHVFEKIEDARMFKLVRLMQGALMAAADARNGK
jgi:hypothetical protein